MSKLTKRLLFYTAVAFFLSLSYFILLYAQGYKYSFTEAKFLRTGAIALKTNESAKVYLNDQLQGETSFLNNAYSVSSLMPLRYKVSVIKDGYAPWVKTVNVEEGFVVDFPKIMLLPEEKEAEEALFHEVDLLFSSLTPVPTLTPSPTPSRSKAKPSVSPSAAQAISQPYVLDSKSNILYQNTPDGLEKIADNVKGFRLSENNNKIAWWTLNELWVMWLNNTDYQPYYLKGEKELITRFQTTIQNGSWFRDEDHVILELEQRDANNRPYIVYRIIEIDTRGGVNIVEL